MTGGEGHEGEEPKAKHRERRALGPKDGDGREHRNRGVVVEQALRGSGTLSRSLVVRASQHVLAANASTAVHLLTN